MIYWVLLWAVCGCLMMIFANVLLMSLKAFARHTTPSVKPIAKNGGNVCGYWQPLQSSHMSGEKLQRRNYYPYRGTIIRPQGRKGRPPIRYRQKKVGRGLNGWLKG